MAVLILSFLLLAAGGSSAPPGMCTCLTEDKPLDAKITQQVKEADLIFEGVVLETHDYPFGEARRLANEDSSQVRFSFGDRRYAFFSCRNPGRDPTSETWSSHATLRVDVRISV
jgi:hypothetical protein